MKLLYKKLPTILFFLYTCQYNTVFCRSILRSGHNKKPILTTQWELESSQKYYLKEWILKKKPIFESFDKEFFYSHILPESVTYRYHPQKKVTKKELSKKIKHLLKEIDQKKTRFTHFTILKKTDFHRRKKCGIMILKFKDHPFVLKVFIETPKTFASPYSKGFCPFFIHGISGGINRHLLGFTRIKNLNTIQQMITNDPFWSKRITLPRKWFWISKKCKNIKLTGKNFSKKELLETIIPSTYCIVADMLHLEEKTFSLFNKKSRRTCISLCNFLNMRIDPYVGNFSLEKKTKKIAIIDTEYFPLYIGSEKHKNFSGYVSEYYSLSEKYIRDMFFKTKKERIHLTENK